MPFRFVHAADIHLDSPLRSLALRDPALADLIGNATRKAFVGLVDLCLEEQVDALLLAGDLYDGDQTSMKTARFLSDQIRRLHEASIRTFIIRGNHDAMSKISAELTFPVSVKLFTRAEAFSFPRPRDALPITIHGMSFKNPHAPDSLLKNYKPPVEGAANIGLMHTSLDGSTGHDPYAPCRLLDLQNSGFRYWALGHIHTRSEAGGDCTVVMPGIPQGRDINEAGPKSVSLVTIQDDQSVQVEERLTSIAQFERVPVDLSGIEEWRDVVTTIATALERKRTTVRSDHLVARLTLTGATPLAWRIRREPDLLQAESAARAADIGKCWVEGVEIRCTNPAVASQITSADPITELRRLIDETVIGADIFQSDISAIAEDLRAQLPPECRALFGKDEKSFQARIEAAVQDGVEVVMARLHAASEAEAQ